MNDDLIGMLRELGDKDFLNRPDPFVSKNAAAKFRMAADRIEELEERLKAATDDAKEAEAYAGELESVLESIKAKLARSERANEALEQLRPVWAQGWTDDSMAAQASVNALSELWAILGAKDQTQAVSALTELKGQDDE